MVDYCPARPLELAFTAAIRPPLEEERAAGGEHLYPVMEGVNHIDVPRTVYRYPLRSDELACAAALGAPLGEECDG